MNDRPDEGAMAALLRLIAARAPGAEIAVFAIAARRIRLVATAAPAAGRPAADWPGIARRVAPIFAAAGASARIDPATLGLAGRFCALFPIPPCGAAPVGFLLVADARRPGPGLAAALADAARIAAPLLAPTAPRRPATAPDPAPPTTAAPQARDVAAPAPGERMRRDLALAARRGQMRLVYQGYLDLADGRISGAEALLRWRHPLRGELAPDAFIPLAEASGLILPLGDWALRAALAAAARWPGRLTLSVNVSALQFHQPGFVAGIEAALAAAGVAPDRLELEITETVLMRDTAETAAQLEALIARGVRIALDDFGTGYSALAYLGRLPHHRIKLDRAFVRDLGNPATLELVRAITALARRTGVAVTAEGVERRDQLSLVRGLGFTHAQGFVTGPPVEDPASLTAAAEPAV